MSRVLNHSNPVNFLFFVVVDVESGVDVGGGLSESGMLSSNTIGSDGDCNCMLDLDILSSEFR